MRILITGATGLIGGSVARSLAADGHELIALTRRPEKASAASISRFLQWDPQKGPPNPSVWEGIEAVIHLAGEPIDAKRWTKDQKRQIRDSRVIGTQNLVAGLTQASTRPKILIAGSAVGYYGDRGDEVLKEDSPAGQGFMSEICRAWEQAALEAQRAGVRVVTVRTGVVLSPEGGALKRMTPPFQFGVGGELGSGKQWFPWIHLDDIVGLFRHALESAQLKGPLNGSAPGVVRNREFTQTLAAVMHRPAIFSVPEFALRILFGEMVEAILASQRVTPELALRTGYKFRFPNLKDALQDLLRT